MTAILAGKCRQILQPATEQQASFAEVLSRNMHPQAWLALHPDIRQRFAAARGKTLSFRGNMERVYCSLPGALLATLLRGLSVLPAICRQWVPFEFHVTAQNRNFIKARYYRFSSLHTFAFTSVYSDAPVLHEEFASLVGMNLQLAEEHGDLEFRDCGYYLRVGSWRLPLPRWLSVGSFELVHRNIDRHHFKVVIRIRHPLLGTLFYQRGEFSATEPCRT